MAIFGLGVTTAGASEAAAAPRPAADFEWNMPSRYGGATDERGRIVETQAYEVRRGPWRVYLKVSGAACAAGAKLRWSSRGKRLDPQELNPCRFVLRVPAEGAYPIRLTATVDGTRLRPTRKKVVVRDWLIVAIGDSVAAGEGVPEESSLFTGAPWQSARCHRSAQAGVARAARQIENDDGRSSVTFVHLACSGAEIGTGLLEPYAGAVPPRDEPALEPQISILNRIAETRQVDAVLISVGANDIHFAGVAGFCGTVPNEDCFSRPLPQRFGGDGVRTVREAVADALTQLRLDYRLLARRISPTVPASRVYLSEYFDPTRDERGVTCESFFGAIGRIEVEQARNRLLRPLNAAGAAAAGGNGWNLVDEVTSSFRNHGYCAGRQAWVSTLGDSLRNLGGLGDRHRGTLHPNRPGHEVIGTLIAADLEQDLYPGRDFPPRPFPEPELDEDDGLSTLAIVALVAAALLLAPAIAPLALFLLPGALLAGLFWLDLHAILPLLLGFAAGVLILVNPGRQTAPAGETEPARPSAPLEDAAEPLLKLVRTARPLLLPLFVAIAVGSATQSALIQFLVAAAVTVAAWKLIVVPEAEKSGVPLGWDRDSRREIVKHVVKYSGIALALGIVVVVVARIAGFTTPYFEAVGDWASGALAIAIFLWAVALLLRLFSFATTALRAVTASLLGLAILALAAGVGVLPGADLVDDEWPGLAKYLGLGALGLLAIDVATSVVAGVRQRREMRRADPAQAAQPQPPRDRNSHTRRAARFGFTAAGAAAVVLAVATGYGLVDAAERADPVNPPEEEVAGAREPAPSSTTGEGGLELARRYAPVLVFGAGERWAPERVDPYVTTATLSGPPGTDPARKSIEGLPSCPEFGQSHCYQLSIECGRKDNELCLGHNREEGRLYRDGAVYVRVLRKGRRGRAEPRGAFVKRGPFRHRLETLIQYWYFYPYNEWRAPVFAGLLVQRHEADWEAVTIGLDRRRRPLFIADSAHCAGSWRPWQEVEASTRLAGPRTHPLVAVAEGSHANYVNAGEKRAPDWASCAGAPAGVTTALSYASNLRDRTGYGWFWFPPADGWISVGADRPPMNFPGRWGAPGGIVLRNLKANPLVDSEAAPATPSLQPLWRAPVETIFCGTYTPEECTRDRD